MGALGAVYSSADRLKRTLRDLFAQPEAYAEQVAGQIRDTMRDKPAEAVLEQWGPGSGVKTLAGILRRGGDPSLVGVHQMSIKQLLPWLQNGRMPREILSPSVALNKEAIPQNFGELTLVMRPDALDPGSGRVAGKIWNRDAYTPRSRAFQGGFDHQAVDLLRELQGTPRKRELRQIAKYRNSDRFNQGGFNDLRTMEGGGDISIPYGQEVAIMTSPSMKSFKEFERNPRGAALLDPWSNPKRAEEMSTRGFRLTLERAADRGNRLANSFLGDHTSMARIVRELPELANEPGAKEIRDLVNNWKGAMAYLPSQYGELKITGPIRADASNWAGALIDEQATMHGPQEIQTLAEILRSRGLPVMTSSGDDLFQKAKLMSERARPAYGR